MFMRMLQLRLNPGFINEFKNFYETIVFPELQKIPGCLYAGLIRRGGKSTAADENEFISITFWDKQSQAENYENSGKFQKLFEQAKPFFSESNEWKIQLSENMQIEYAPASEEPVIKKYTVEASEDENQKLEIQDEQPFIRIVSLKIQENKFEEFKKLYSDVIIPSLKATKGCRNIFLTESINERNEFISVTIWGSKEEANNYESSGKFKEMIDKTKHTYSQFYLWKTALEKDYNAKVATTDDLKIERYDIITGENFL